MNRTSAFLPLVVCTIILLGTLARQVEGADFESLSGSLPPVVEKKEKPYLVTALLEVSEGQKVVVEKGVVFLFKNFTGLNIQGTILVRGTKDEPVVFTSENDTLYNPTSTLEPAPFDWDGITVYQTDSMSVFKNCVISYSLFGINSNTKSIELNKCSFIQNGNADFTTEGEKQFVTYPFYSYSPLKEEESIAAKEGITPSAGMEEEKAAEEKIPGETGKIARPEPKAQEPKAERRKKVDLVQEAPGKRSGPKIVFRLLSGAAIFAGGTLGVVQTMDYVIAKEDFDNINDCTGEDLVKYTSMDWENAKNRTNEHLRNMVICYGFAVLGATVFTFTFAF